MTQHNVFIRKFGDKAVIITVTDWGDFKELEKFSKDKDPDFLIGGITRKSPYSNMLPVMTLNTGEPMDITEGTRGMGLDGIITGDSNAGPIWSIKKHHDYGF